MSECIMIELTHAPVIIMPSTLPQYSDIYLSSVNILYDKPIALFGSEVDHVIGHERKSFVRSVRLTACSFLFLYIHLYFKRH